ncbi:hypothetical protein HG536_0A04510 [Torulaspora globosa]|uniref:MHD domain-containing protein n=1 Tax=Torulaspora globosa TaxID=48254 RepID=A0A7G3ZAU8_9SACH|nr:uncharacterized protein HG536_0A04510 [Torulaspora globosa]QLL30634.1 hypothetical protein HG536_0A04510 [Torulaspora globosa]
MFIAFYITDSKYSLVFQYLLSSKSPSFEHLRTKVQEVCPKLMSDANTTESGTRTNDGNGNLNAVRQPVGKNLELYKYYSSTNKLYYFCLTSACSSGSKCSPFVFMEDMDRLFLEYFDKDQLTASKIKNNYDRITMIFYVCVSGGVPAAGKLYSNSVKKVVPVRSDLSKIITSTAHTLQVAVQRQGQQHGERFGNKQSRFETDSSLESEMVPWRSAGLKYTNNEFYVDMTEEIHVTYQKSRKTSGSNLRFDSSKMTMVCGTINGRATVRCYLSDTPSVELQLDLAGNDMGVPALHNCIENKTDLSNLKFIPPDGKFSLIQYSIDLDQVSQSRRYNSCVGLITLDFKDQLGTKKDEFELTVNIANSREVESIQDLCIGLELQPPTDNNSQNRDTTQDSEFKIKVLRNTHGRFDNSVVSGKGAWIFDKDTPTGSLPVLRGCVENSTGLSCDAKVQRVSLSYTHTGQLISGIRVKAININSQGTTGTKPFKGVKYMTTTGDYEIRS